MCFIRYLDHNFIVSSKRNDDDAEVETVKTGNNLGKFPVRGEKAGPTCEKTGLRQGMSPMEREPVPVWF